MKGTSYHKGQPTGQLRQGAIHLATHGLMAVVAHHHAAVKTWKDHTLPAENITWTETPDEETAVFLCKQDPELTRTAFANAAVRLWVRKQVREDEEGWVLEYGVRWMTGDVTVYLHPDIDSAQKETLLNSVGDLDAATRNCLMETLAPTRILMDNEKVAGRPPIPLWESEKQEAILEKRNKDPKRWVVVAQDVQEGSAFKKYKLVDTKDITDLIAGTDYPFYYELVQKDTPVRLVVDAEMPWEGTPTWNERMDFRNGLLHYINQALETTTGYTRTPRWVTKNNAREGKMSLHLILQDVYFKDHTDGPKAILLEARRALLQDVGTKGGHLEAARLTYTRHDKRKPGKAIVETAIDTSIYTKNRVIRFLGCAKRKEDRAAAHAIVARVETDAPDQDAPEKGDDAWREAFQAMRVTLADRDDLDGPGWTCLSVPETWERGGLASRATARPRTKPLDLPQDKNKTLKQTNGEGGEQDPSSRPTGSLQHPHPSPALPQVTEKQRPTLSPEDQKSIDALLATVRKDNPEATLSNVRMEKRYWTLYLAKARTCKIRQGDHKSNNIYVSWDTDTGEIRQGCHDEDCMQQLIKGLPKPCLGTLRPETKARTLTDREAVRLTQLCPDVHLSELHCTQDREQTWVNITWTKEGVAKSLLFQRNGDARVIGGLDAALLAKSEARELHNTLFEDHPQWAWKRLWKEEGDVWDTLDDASMKRIATFLSQHKKVSPRRKTRCFEFLMQEGPKDADKKMSTLFIKEKELLFEYGLPKMSLVLETGGGLKRKREEEERQGIELERDKKRKGLENYWNLAREQGTLELPPTEDMDTDPKHMLNEGDFVHLSGVLTEKKARDKLYYLQAQYANAVNEGTVSIMPSGMAGAMLAPQTIVLQKEHMKQALVGAGFQFNSAGTLVMNVYGNVINNIVASPERTGGEPVGLQGNVTIGPETTQRLCKKLQDWHTRKGYPLHEEAYIQLVRALMDDKNHLPLSWYIANRMALTCRYASNPFVAGDTSKWVLIVTKNGRYVRRNMKVEVALHYDILGEWFRDLALFFKENDDQVDVKRCDKKVMLSDLFNLLWDSAQKTILQKITSEVEKLLQDDDFYSKLDQPTTEEFFMELDRQSHIMGLKNGIYDVETQTFTPNGRACLPYLATYSTNYDIDVENAMPNEDAIRVEIETMLYQRLFPDEAMRKRAKQMIASLLIAGNESKVMWWLLGGRNTGKSSLIHALTAVFQDYASTADISIIMRDLGAVDKPREDLVDVMNKKVVFCSENNKQQRLNVKSIKTIQGGDDISMRGMYGKIQKQSCMPTFVIATNDVPTLDSVADVDTLNIKFIDFKVDMTQGQTLGKKEWKAYIKKWAPVHFKMIAEWYAEWVREGKKFVNVETEAERQVAEQSEMGRFIDFMGDQFYKTEELFKLVSKEAANEGRKDAFEFRFYKTLRQLRESYMAVTLENFNVSDETLGRQLLKNGYCWGAKRARLGKTLPPNNYVLVAKREDSFEGLKEHHLRLLKEG